MTHTVPIPGSGHYEVVADAPGIGPGNWAGAPTAALAADGSVLLAYRIRTASGRGAEQVLARSIDGGIIFTEIGRWAKSAFGAESLERPSLACDGTTWHLYVSCATPGSKHWRIDLLRASTPERLLTAQPHTVFAGDATLGVKDPVIRWRDGAWRGWVCCHPLDRPGAEDRMFSRLSTSPDGVDWAWQDQVLEGRAGTWDARGVRVTAVLDNPVLDDPVPDAPVPDAPVPDAPAQTRTLVYYDGRRSAAENFAERTGLAAIGPDGTVDAGSTPVANVRYLDVLDLQDGTCRLYYEAPLPDGSHELRTESANLTLLAGRADADGGR